MADDNALPLSQIDRILLLGDTHGNATWTAFVIDQAAKLDAKLILQLGDFGYWPRQDWGRGFLDATEKTLGEYSLPLWFIDGNHEDHVALRSVSRPPGLYSISDHISYLARGTRWTWGDTVWLAAGGASSVDRHFREPGVEWFPEEFMTEEQFKSIENQGHADVVVAHDAPAGIGFLIDWRATNDLPVGQGWPLDAIADAEAHQGRLRHLLEATQPGAWFHGHHHVAYHENLATGFGATDVYGLDRDGTTLLHASLLVGGDGAAIPWKEVLGE